MTGGVIYAWESIMPLTPASLKIIRFTFIWRTSRHKDLLIIFGEDDPKDDVF